MSSTQLTHATLLALQLASVFKHVDDLGIHREKFNGFTQVEGEHGDVITTQYLEGSRKGRNYVEAMVNSDRNGFRFRQQYNFGILLELEVSYLHENGDYRSMLDAIRNQSEEESYLTELMIDFEYCISIFTEHVAQNIKLT